MEAMLKITRIAELNNGFLVIFEDGSELRLSEEVYFTCSVYEKEEMSEDEIEELLFKEQVTDGLIACKKYLAGGLKPRRRLFAYLEDKGYAGEVRDAVIEILDEDGYTDDMKYSLKKIKRKMITSPVSSRMMLKFLENEGISPDIAAKAVTESKINDMETAVKIAQKRLRKNEGDMKKTAVYLLSKGFDEDMVVDILGMEDLWIT
jgi:SOS response regulatory protein OraA/RecX